MVQAWQGQIRSWERGPDSVYHRKLRIQVRLRIRCRERIQVNLHIYIKTSWRTCLISWSILCNSAKRSPFYTRCHLTIINVCVPSVLDATTGMIKIHDPWADIDNGEWQPWEILLASSLFTKIMILHLSSFTLFRILFKDCSSKAGGRF